MNRHAFAIRPTGKLFNAAPRVRPPSSAIKPLIPGQQIGGLARAFASRPDKTQRSTDPFMKPNQARSWSKTARRRIGSDHLVIFWRMAARPKGLQALCSSAQSVTAQRSRLRAFRSSAEYFTRRRPQRQPWRDRCTHLSGQCICGPGRHNRRRRLWGGVHPCQDCVRHIGQSRRSRDASGCNASPHSAGQTT